MKKRSSEFMQIDLLKEQYQQKIKKQEQLIRASLTELSDDLSGVKLFNRVKESLFSGSGFAFKLGFLAVTMLRRKMAERKRRKT